MNLTQAELRDIVYNFIVYGDFLVGVPFGGGHVNDTYQLRNHHQAEEQGTARKHTGNNADRQAQPVRAGIRNQPQISLRLEFNFFCAVVM